MAIAGKTGAARGHSPCTRSGRVLAVVLSLCLAACSGGSKQSGTAVSPAASTRYAPSASASGTQGATARLAYSNPRGMNVALFAATGTQVGKDTVVGPADDLSQPMWSPQGRYLVWWYEAPNAEESRLEIYDTRTAHLASVRLEAPFTWSAFATGAMSASPTELKEYDRLGGIVASRKYGPADVGSLRPASAVALSDGGSIVETLPASDTGPGRLWRVPVNGAPAELGTVGAVAFLGDSYVADIGPGLARYDLKQAAVLTQLGQDGACAPGGTVHLLSLPAGPDQVVSLPPDNGDSVGLINPSYSPDGVLGGILHNCGSETAATGNRFVELRAGQWSVVAEGANVAARGPGGLLAVQTGGFVAKEYVRHPVPGYQGLRVLDPTGTVRAELGPAYSATWGPAAGPP